ncbi:hypothetical protein V1509DRAFT_144738 [Lipomyces kononenkoae]
MTYSNLRKPSRSGLETILIEYRSQQEKKRDGDPLRDQHTVRRDAIRIDGDFLRQLMERWRCRGENCTNKNNFCFPDPTDTSRHYNITTSRHEMWSNSMAVGEATMRCWEQNQGCINRLSPQPTEQPAIQQTRSTVGRVEMQQQMQPVAFMRVTADCQR